MKIKSGSHLTVVSRDRLGSTFDRAELRLRGLKPPVHSFELRLFADEPSASAKTPTADNPNYLGSQFFYGLGTEDLGADAKDIYHVERESQSAPTEVRVNVTPGLRAYLEHATAERFPIKAVAVDRDGVELPEPDLDIENASLVVL